MLSMISGDGADVPEPRKTTKFPSVPAMRGHRSLEMPEGNAAGDFVGRNVRFRVVLEFAPN